MRNTGAESPSPAVRLLVAALTLAATLVAAPADAQPAPWQPERLTAGWTFTPGLVVGAMWDTNVTVQSAGNPISKAWSGLVNPRGELDFNGRHTHFNAGYSGSMERYRHLNQLDRYDQRGKLTLRQQMSPRVQLNASSSYTVSPTTDRLELGEGTQPFVDIGAESFQAGGGFNVALTRTTRLEADYRFQHVTFDRAEAQGQFEFLQGGRSHAPAVRVSHDVSRRLSLGGGWEYRRATIGHADPLVVDPAASANPPLNTLPRVFDVQNVGGHASFRINSTTSVGAGFGIAHLRVSDTQLTSWGPAYQGGIERRQGQVRLSARYARSFIPSLGFGGLTANESFGGNVFVPFARGRMYVSGGASYARTQPVELLGLTFRVDSVGIDTAVGYQVASWLRAEGFYTGTHQTSTARGNVDRARVGFQFLTFKPVRIQ